MRAVLRILSVTSIAGFALILSQRIPAVAHAVEEGTAATLLGAVGAVTAFSAFGSWALAIYHWGSRFPPASPSRRLWGRVVIFGAFIGAWVYSFVAPIEEA